MEERPLRRDPPGVSSKPAASLRCCCGSLLARLVEGGVELKCRRCKRQIIIPLTAEGRSAIAFKNK